MVESSPMTLGIRQFVSCALAAGLSLAAFAVSAGEVRGVALVNGATGTRAEIQLAGAGGYKTLSLAGPNRLVVDFPDSAAVRGLALPAPTGVVTAVRIGQPTPGTFRVVFDLSASVTAFKPQMQSQGGQSKLVIEWPGEPATA
ncbi:AMIN domain-containing protein, partial [Xanthomonas sp. Kuri4-3]